MAAARDRRVIRHELLGVERVIVARRGDGVQEDCYLRLRDLGRSGEGRIGWRAGGKKEEERRKREEEEASRRLEGSRSWNFELAGE